MKKRRHASSLDDVIWNLKTSNAKCMQAIKRSEVHMYLDGRCMPSLFIHTCIHTIMAQIIIIHLFCLGEGDTQGCFWNLGGYFATVYDQPTKTLHLDSLRESVCPVNRIFCWASWWVMPSVSSLLMARINSFSFIPLLIALPPGDT